MQDPRLGGSSELVDLPKIDLDEMSNPKRVEEVLLIVLEMLVLSQQKALMLF